MRNLTTWNRAGHRAQFRKHFMGWVLLPVLIFAGCDNLIEYSPYQAGIRMEETARNTQTVSFLEDKGKGAFHPFKIALVSDSHTYYDDFKFQIEKLIKLDSIDFVVHLGDITLSGIQREFLWYNQLVEGLKYPLITLIGNHDYLSNGDYLYKEIFGPTNFTMDYRDCRFVFFDDIVWERNARSPDFEWLYTEGQGEDKIHRLFFAHIPPWDEQLGIGNGFLLGQILENHQVTLGLYGHCHSFYYGKKDSVRYGDTPSLVVGDSQDREIVVLEIREDTVLVDRKRYER